MCGIVGYFGDRKASEVVLNGLSKLEYRGYDSAGLAIKNEKGIECRKFKGKLENLRKSIESKDILGGIGIGHTRWATHGVPSDINSHPHCDSNKNIYVVHNGIIENYKSLKAELEAEGVEFTSTTDTEVVAQLIAKYYVDDFKKAVIMAISRLKGSYALGIICKDTNELIAVRNESPLILGLGKDEYFIASDIPAILNYTRSVIYLENGNMVHIKDGKYEIFDKNQKKIDLKINTVKWDIKSSEKEGYEFFMEKEIFEQEHVISQTIEKSMLNLENIDLDFNSISKIYFVACGTAYNAGTIGKMYFEDFLNKPCYTQIASEFRYTKQFIDEKTLVVVISQSGETADTLAAVAKAKEHNCKLLAITNVVGSSIAREIENVFYTFAGPEIAVASTKAYTTQIIALYLIAKYFSCKDFEKVKKEALNISEYIKEVLAKKEEIKNLAKNLVNAKDIFYLGRSVDYYLANEGALKLKEISYIHAESFAAGELKHGTIALIEKDTPVIAISTVEDLYEKMISNIQEVKSRGAKVIDITNNESMLGDKNSIIIPKIDKYLTPIIAIIPLQILAYYVSYLKGFDVDKPRNLAKSVTVE